MTKYSKQSDNGFRCQEMFNYVMAKNCGKQKKNKMKQMILKKYTNEEQVADKGYEDIDSAELGRDESGAFGGSEKTDDGK